MVSYPERTNSIAAIDKMLNWLEQPIKARFFSAYSGRAVMTNVRKIGNGFKPHHLELMLDGTTYRVKGTKCIRLDTLDAEIVGEVVTVPVLRVPLGLEEYKKTWGSCDLILGETSTYGAKGLPLQTTLYWLDTKALLLLIEKLKESQELPGLDEFGNPTAVWYTKESLHVGIELVNDLLNKFHIVRQIDEIDWKSERVHPTKVSFFNTSQDSKGLDFGFRGATGESVTKYLARQWQGYPLTMRADQSRKILVTFLESGDEYRYLSAKQAIGDFARAGMTLSSAQISNVLRGRAKTIKTARGRIKVEYVA